jgi:VCBS repeat protein
MHALGLLVIASQAGGAELISHFQAGNGGWHLGTLAVGNLDSDPALEIVIPCRDNTGSWFLDAFDFNGTRLPGFPYASGGEEMNVSPTLVDLNGDGRREILITRANKVVALRGDGSVLWSTPVTPATYVPNGGYQTVTNGFWWSDGRAFRPRLPDNAVFSSQVSPPIVADIGANGTKLVVTGWKIDPDPLGGAQDFNPFIGQTYGYIDWGITGETWSGGVVFFDALTGTKDFAYHLHQLVESGLALGQADTDAALETYALTDSDSVVCFDKTQPHGLWGKGALHKQFGKNQRLMSGSYLAGIDVHTADIDGDGRDEVLVAGTQLSPLWEPNETILDDDGAILWRKWLPQITIDNRHGWLNSAAMIPCNPDHDHRADVLSFNHSYEIAFRYWDGAELVDHPGWPKDFAPYLPTPPVVGDVDGDGDQEILIGTYNPSVNPSDGQLLIFALNGTLKMAIPVPGGLKHIPSLADINADGRLDVIYRSLTGEVFVQSFGATGTNVSWATHRGNQQRDGRASMAQSGTPIITGKTSAYRSVNFSWSNSAPATLFRIYRADQAAGPFIHVATVTPGTFSYSDHALQSGTLYFYEIAAVYGTNAVRSAPFCILPLANSNLVANAGFEENDNSHWDKWFTDHVSQTNMLASSTAFQGKRSMRVKLASSASSTTISQFNQYGIPDASLPVTPGTLCSFGGWLKSGGINQPSEQWWEWTSEKDADTNNRPLLPWPDSFTPHFVIDTNATTWVYANRTFLMPSGFPSIQLRHRYSCNAPLTGSIYLDNAFFRPLPPPNSTAWSNLISFGSTWAYSTNTPPPGWFKPDFNDTAWLRAPAKFGAGSGPQNITTRLPSRKTAYYFRKKFVVNINEPEELILAATCTDNYGGKVYPLRIFLNGTELITTGIEAVTGQGNDIRYYDLQPFAHLLSPGTNNIAVILQNTWATDFDDIAFDLNLKAIPYRGTPPQLKLLSSPSEPVTLRRSLESSTPPNTLWQIRSCDSLSGTPWRVLATFTNTTTLPQLRTIIDPEPMRQCRFYQLVPY